MKCRSKFGSGVTGRRKFGCNGEMDPAARSQAHLQTLMQTRLQSVGSHEADLLHGARLAAENAGRLICQAVQTRGLKDILTTREEKGDGSPVSAIDLLAHDSLARDLAKLAAFPIVSEEDPDGPLALEHIEADGFFWIVDPLDGTRDFLAGEKTFAVALALMRKLLPEEREAAGGFAHPYLGVIHDPSGERTWGAVRFGNLQKWVRGQPAKLPRESDPRPRRADGELRVLGSRSIPSHRLQELYRFWGTETVERMGSALKFALIAEGSFDVYPRFGPTAEWDTAAGQVLLEVSGGGIVPIALPVRPMPYGKPAWLTPGFLAAGSQSLLAKWVPTLVQKLR